MTERFRHLPKRIESIRLRLRTLSSARRIVALPAANDITEQQWSFLQSQLSAVEAQLTERVKHCARELLPQLQDPRAALRLNALLGEIEQDVARAFSFFDTYMDVLTQRHAPELGPLLAGCDVLAWDALHKDVPALAVIERPLVYCDRGFGASILREGVRLPDQSPNPAPLIQIPYSRLKEKYNLTSILHEAGHEAAHRLGFTTHMPSVFREALRAAGAPSVLQEFFSLWTSEIAPDFWAFCASGIAHTGGSLDILAIPPRQALRIAWNDPHPPAYLRLLLSASWCRHLWGRGEWNSWENDWRQLYPLNSGPPACKRILEQAEQYLPVVTRTLFESRFDALSGRTIPDLFALADLNPTRLARIADALDSGKLNLRGLSPCAHLAVFRLVRERGRLSEEQLDELMTRWLIQLGAKRK